jgi:hypothetical protein
VVRSCTVSFLAMLVLSALAAIVESCISGSR